MTGTVARTSGLGDGEAIVEGAIAVVARGYLRHVLYVAGQWIAEIECDGSGLFVAPLRVVRVADDGSRIEPPPPAPVGPKGTSPQIQKGPEEIGRE